MIIIYQGSHPYFPWAACRLHCEFYGRAVLADSAHGWLSARDWRRQPFYRYGIDGNGDAVCCLVYRKYGPIYGRAIAGITNIFRLDVKIKDVDEILRHKASFHPMMATCLDLVRWSGTYIETELHKLMIEWLRLEIEKEAR